MSEFERHVELYKSAGYSPKDAIDEVVAREREARVEARAREREREARDEARETRACKMICYYFMFVLFFISII